ncbi:EAL domain-containing protein [Acholeplasma sp. OttesenSCG-928-E16]|nr:EAL domain-containing protein [Acholeplasma sp. OttesenSCG-928-E16]
MIKKIDRTHKVLIASILLLLTIVISLFGVYFGVTNNSKEKINQEVVTNISMKNARNFYEFTSSKSQLLTSHASTLAKMDLNDIDTIYEYMESICRGSSFLKVGYSNLDGLFDFIDSNGKKYPNQDFKEDDIFNVPMNGNIYISEYVSNDFSGIDVTYYSVPVTKNNMIVGILTGINNNLIIKEIFNAPLYNGSGYSFVISRDGKIVTSASRLAPKFNVGDDFFLEYQISRLNQSRLLENGINNKETTLKVNYKGSENQVSIIPVGINGWQYVGMVETKILDIAYYKGRAISITTLVVLLISIGLLAVFIDRSFKKNKAIIEELAYHDSLTGLMNYSKFQVEANKLIQKNQDINFAVWSLDIKNFTQINELYGRRYGDKILKKIAETLNKHNSNEQELYCRTGADHFAGMISYATKENLNRWYDRLIFLLDQSMENDIGKNALDYRIGFYCLKDFNEDITIMQMVNNASFARGMYEKDNFESSILSKKMREDNHLRATLEKDAKEALLNQEFTFYLQPKVDIHNENKIVGAEALCRWNHKTLGNISPATFIPIFEENGFIVDLDRYIFEKVCKWLSNAQKENNLDLCVSVNVSVQGARKDDFLDYYCKTKKKYKVKNRSIELEFTESVLARDHEAFNIVISRLQKEGFSCSIDDFGSGFSSLNLLKNIDIDVLKLDGMFFRESIDEKKGKTLIAGFLKIANDLNIKTVAEGVEEEKDIQFLKKTYCNQVQGFIFSKPMKSEDFIEYYNENNGKGVIHKD